MSMTSTIFIYTMAFHLSVQYFKLHADLYISDATDNNSYLGMYVSLGVYPLDLVTRTISVMDLIAYLTMEDKTYQNGPKVGGLWRRALLFLKTLYSFKILIPVLFNGPNKEALRVFGSILTKYKKYKFHSMGKQKTSTSGGKKPHWCSSFTAFMTTVTPIN